MSDKIRVQRGSEVAEISREDLPLWEKTGFKAQEFEKLAKHTREQLYVMGEAPDGAELPAAEEKIDPQAEAVRKVARSPKKSAE